MDVAGVAAGAERVVVDLAPDRVHKGAEARHTCHLRGALGTPLRLIGEKGLPDGLRELVHHDVYLKVSGLGAVGGLELGIVNQPMLTCEGSQHVGIAQSSASRTTQGDLPLLGLVLPGLLERVQVILPRVTEPLGLQANLAGQLVDLPHAADRDSLAAGLQDNLSRVDNEAALGQQVADLVLATHLVQNLRGGQAHDLLPVLARDIAQAAVAGKVQLDALFRALEERRLAFGQVPALLAHDRIKNWGHRLRKLQNCWQPGLEC
mmetsp:Transcript_61199/g.179468  ORF Transcript_61199/g.179468 Transcript_61199/m.179468 type:complete len:263 (-) Transcript_61199:2-790(-)